MNRHNAEAGPTADAERRSLLSDENRAHLTTTLANLEGATANLKPALENLNATLVQVRKMVDDHNIRNLSQAASEVAFARPIRGC